jgi:putative photosynthetic complex assembly protein
MASNTQPRIHAREEELVPRIMVRIMFGLVLTILVIVTVATLTGRKPTSAPPEGAVLSERAIFLSGDASGAARVLDQHGTVIADFPPEKGGFVAGIERVIARERGLRGLDMSQPVVLQLKEGNRLSITDPTTGWSAELMGFGATNSRTFARLLDQP